MPRKLNESYRGTARDLSENWVDPIDGGLVEGHPSLSPYSGREPLWFAPDPFLGWRTSMTSRICFQCGRKGDHFDPFCSGTDIHRERMKIRNWYLEQRRNGTLGYRAQSGWRRLLPF
jgi:hypothetical protein